MKAKNILSILLTVSMCSGLLAGCGNGEQQKDTSKSEQQTEDGAFMDHIEEDAQITYWEMQWGGNGDYEKVVQKLVDRFNEENEYGIKVDMQMIPWDGYYQTFLTAVTSGAAPDCATGPSANPIQYAVMGESLDLDPVMEAWKEENNPILDEIDDSLWEYYEYKGTQYGIPWAIDPKEILYRSDYFEEAGITELPETYEELIEAARILKEKFPDKSTVLAATGENSGAHLAFVLNACNNVGFTTEDLKADMTNQGQIENLQFMQTLYDEKLISEGAASYTSSEMQKIWMAGEACILLGHSGNFCEGTDLEDVTRVLPNISGPNAEEGKYVNIINGINGFSQTEYPNATRYFIKWWSENNKELLVDGKQGNFPARSSYYEDTYYKESQWRMDVYKYCIQNGQTAIYPVKNLYPQFAQLEGEMIFGAPYVEVLTGTDAETAAEHANEKIQKIIEEYGE